MAPQPVRALTLVDKLLMPPDNQLKSQVSQYLRTRISTSPFDDQVEQLDYNTVSVYYEMVVERGIKEPLLTLEERIVFATKIVHWLQSREFGCEGRDDFAAKAAKFFKKNVPKEWVRQFFQESPKPDGKTMESSGVSEEPLIEGPAKLDKSNSVRAVHSVNGRTNNGKSTKTPAKRDVIERLSQGLTVGATHGAHIGQSKNDLDKDDVICSPNEGFSLVGDEPASNGRLVGIECREGVQDSTEGLENKAVSNDQAIKSHRIGDWEESALEGKHVETSEARTLAAGNGNARVSERVRADAETSAPHVSTPGNVDTRSNLDESSAAKNVRVQSKSAEVELLEDSTTHGEKMEAGPLSRKSGEPRPIDANCSNGMADEDGSDNTAPKQAMSLKHELPLVTMSKMGATGTKQAGGELREKGHSRHTSVQGPTVDQTTVGQMESISAKTSTVFDVKLEEGEHPGSHIPFPGGNRPPKFFRWSGDGHLGPYFVVVIEQNHALGGGLVGLLGLLAYVVCGWWT